jgi:glycosyltransferase involved in cell wall biosynthesis
VQPGVVAPEPPDDPRAPLALAGVPRDAPVIGMVARLQRWKGPHVLLQAAPAILERFPGAHFVFVGGDDPLEPSFGSELRRQAANMGLSDRVHFVGFQDDGASWMYGFDVVVHASDSEPFGIVILEAMVRGRPLVAGADGGPGELIIDGRDGFLVPFAAVDRLADRVCRLLDDPALARQLGESARRAALAYTPERFASGLLAELEGAAMRTA